ncbi:hypothetical protein ACLMJK_008837 [Lecanora helva]
MQERNPFQQLVVDLKAYLDHSPGSLFSDIDPGPIIKFMKSYKSESSHWLKYAHRDKDKCFTRNLIDPGNGKWNLLILVWSPGKESPIHDHASSHCVMKMLQGSLREIRYEWPGKRVLEGKESSPLMLKSETRIFEDKVTYMSDNATQLVQLDTICIQKWDSETMAQDKESKT